MNRLVPEWDRSSGMLDDLIPSSGFHGPANGKLDFLRSKSTRFFQVSIIHRRGIVSRELRMG